MKGFHVRNAAAPARVELQHRFVTLKDVSADEATRTFEGYASVWNVIDTYGTEFAQGCFKRTLGEWRAKGAWPDFLLQHDISLVAGKWLDMREDDIGLWVRGQYVKSAFGDHGLACVREGIATGLSIGFVMRGYEIDDRNDQSMLITDVDLYEISQVTKPANPAAGFTALRAVQPNSTRREVEAMLRHLGVPRDAAKRMAAQWREGDGPRDAASLGQDEARPRDAGAIQSPSLADAIRAAANALKG
jgi:uncharacterized protein